MHNEGKLELAKLEKMHAKVPDDNQLTHLLAEHGINVPVIHLHGGSEPEKVEVNVSPDSPLKITNAVNATGWKKSIVDRHNDQNYARSQITIEYPFKGRERKRPDAVLRTGGYTAELGFRSHASMSYLYLIARIASKKEVRDFKKHAPTFERLLIELAKGD